MIEGLTGVPRTALFTLRARADEHRKRRGRFEDPWAAEWLARLGWPRELDRFYSGWIQGKNAARAAQIDAVLRRLSGELDLVVELGCGLSSRRQRLQEDFRGAWVDVDLPEIVRLRAALGADVGATTVAGSALDDAWLDAVRAPPARVAVIAEGLLYYLPEADVRAAFARWRARLPGTSMAFDVIGALDFEAARGYSRRLGADIHWAAPPPFEAAMAELGLAPIEGLEPDAVLKDALLHVGPGLRPLLAGFSKLTFLKDRRSGLMVGRLCEV